MKRSLLVPVVVAALLVATLGANAAPVASHSSRHHQAVELSKRLLSNAPKLGSERAVSKTSLNILKRPPEFTTFRQQVDGERFWTDPQRLHTVVKDLAAEMPHGVSGGSPGIYSRQGRRVISKFFEYRVNPRPYDIFQAYLYLIVASTGKNNQHSAIGAYTEVVPFPKRPKSEHVSASVPTATLGASEQGKPTRTRFLNAKQTHRLVVAFDKLRVQPPGGIYVCPGPIRAYSDITAAFAGSKRLVADPPGCDGINVTARSGRTPDLDATGSYDNTLRKVWREAKSTQVESD